MGSPACGQAVRLACWFFCNLLTVITAVRLCACIWRSLSYGQALSCTLQGTRGGELKPYMCPTCPEQYVGTHACAVKYSFLCMPLVAKVLYAYVGCCTCLERSTTLSCQHRTHCLLVLFPRTLHCTLTNPIFQNRPESCQNEIRWLSEMQHI